MMKKGMIVLISLLLLISLFYFFGKPILLRIGGFKEPVLESPSSIKQYIKQEGEPYDVLAIPKSRETFRILQRQVGGIPSIVFFDKQRKVIKSSKGMECPKAGRSFVEELQYGQSYKAEEGSTASLETILQSIRVIDGDSAGFYQQVDSGDFEFILAYMWAKMLPKQSNEMMQVGTEVRNRMGDRVLILSINADFSDVWMDSTQLKKEIEAFYK